MILNERASSYVQDLQIALETLVRHEPVAAHPASARAPLGRVFVLRADLISPETRALARVGGARRCWSDSAAACRSARPRAGRRDRDAPPLAKQAALAGRSRSTAAAPPSDLEFFNGLGGFAEDGREYVTILGPGQSTPAPWINVVANPGFGFQVATEGGGYTWSVNSRENQLTPWSNDPVTDRPGEAFYLRDEDTGDLWSPTALPIRDERHLCRPARPGIQPVRA